MRPPISVIGILLLVLLPAFLFGCATKTDEESNQLLSYLQAKQNYANAIQNNSGGVFNTNRRLVPIPPFSEPFPPGTYLLKQNFRPLSRSCAPANPLKFSLPDPPEIRSKATFNFAADSSYILADFLGAEVQASIEHNKTAVLKFVDLTAIAASIEDRGGPAGLDSMFHSLSGASRCSAYAAVCRAGRLSKYTPSGVCPSSARWGLVWV